MMVASARRLILGAGDVDRIPIPLVEQLLSELDNRASTTLRERARELDLPAILLVGDQSELFAEVDRLRAEGELRLAVVLPLLALTVFLALNGSLWWLAMLPAMAALWIQGIRREDDAKKSTADAIRLGRVPSSAAGKFEEWVNDLPNRIASVEEQAPKR